MQHEPDAGVTAVVVIAHAALRRSAWEALLARQPGLSVAETAADLLQMTATASSDGPAAILVDGAGLGAERAAELVAAAGGKGVLWVMEEVELEAVVALLRAGVMGCLGAEASVGELARAVVAVGRGEIALPPPVAAPALAALARPTVADRRAVDELTAREREVVDLLVEGRTNKDIAQTMFLSVRTVEAHLRSIYDKLHVRSRTEAVLWAIEHQRDEGHDWSSVRPPANVPRRSR